MNIIIILLVIIIIIFFLNYYMTNKSNKVIVFDMDETLGHFSQLGIVIESVQRVIKKKINQMEFNYILDCFPLYLRTDILKILNYLKNKKLKNELDKVIIFTNNQGPKEWSNKIKNYFNYKLNYNLFDQVIGAYMVNGNIIEHLRTSHNKRYQDLLRIAKLPINTKICFIDDVYHLEMENKNLFYINIYPYEYEYSYSNILNIVKTRFNYSSFSLNIISKELNKYKISKNELMNQKEISNELFDNIKQFLTK